MIECGEMYFINGNKKDSVGHEMWPNRPAVIISSEDAVINQGTVNVVYLTSAPNESSNDKFLVKISNDSFIDNKNKYEKHFARCGQVDSVDKTRLGSFFGRISEKELKQIEAAVKKSLFRGA